MMRGLTSGNLGEFATANAVEFGTCANCDAGNEACGEDECPLFRDDNGEIRCCTCIEESRDL